MVKNSTKYKVRIMGSAGKVLIIVQNLPVPFDRRVWLEAKSLTEADYLVSIISPTGKHGSYQERHEIIDGIHIYRYASPPEAHGVWGYIFEFIYCWIMTAFLSIKVWRNHDFEILHACNPPETYFLLGRFYKLFGKKFLFDHHDLSPEMYVAKGGEQEGFLYRGLLCLEKQTFKTADVIITTNKSHKRIAIERGDIDPKNIYIVRSGPDFERLKVLEPDPGLKDGFQYLVCYLGEMCAQDGVDHLLEAAKYVIFEKKRRDVKFILLGGGPELERLMNLSYKIGLEPYVEFKGRVSDYELSQYLSTADICLDPDPYSDWADKSTMNKIMEYMAFGKPIVAFDLGEHRYSAQEAAIYAEPNDVVDFADKIITLLDDGVRRNLMGNIGYERIINELAWAHQKPTLLAAYAKLINP
jgi:glycosyltransferase involved in cell wall biosynthesis